ncbi:MAG: hypothetical protein V2I43_16050, partial [Parvularcula sp.]|nr:hypothetical protein [Parvularcula sp.]
LISCSDVRERIFPTWSMGLHEGMDSGTRDIWQAETRVDAEAAMATFAAKYGTKYHKVPRCTVS